MHEFELTEEHIAETQIIVIGTGRSVFTPEEINEMMTVLAEKIGVAIEVIASSVNALCQRVGTAASELADLFNSFVEASKFVDEMEKKRTLYKLDFTRKKIEDQVICRKPKQLIKKVIG